MQATAPTIGGVLPVELTRFIGRERELADLRALAGTSRLLTLTGAGGSGKSRLTLELLPHLGAIAADGVVWVELAPITDGGLVAGAVLREVDPSAEAGAAATERLSEALRGHTVLLVLDNCEHVVDAAAALADSLLRACPQLHIIATSREALGVRGERAWLVPPLSLPSHTCSVADAAASDAVRLFAERARDVASDFQITEQNAQVVAAICARLDGIPLAIELAAARIRLMTLEQIRDRLSDAFALLTSSSRSVLPRHRTLRATIDWSHDLLQDEARAVLRRLAVFRGGFTLDAAEAVASGDDIGDYADHDVAAAEVLDIVAALLDRSMLFMREQHGSARYYMLETMRQYGAQRLAEAGEEMSAQHAMARHFATLVADAEPDFTTRRRREAFALLEPELDNLREVLAWSHAHEPQLHVRLVGLLWWFWFTTRHWVEAQRWIEGALALPAGSEPGQLRARLLFAGGALSSLQANVAHANELLQESITLCDAVDDRRLEAYALSYLAMTRIQVGDVTGREYADRAVAWFRANDDEYGLRLSLLLLGMGEAAVGDMPRARARLEEAVAVARSFGKDRELGVSLQTLAGVLLDAGGHAEAEQLLIESVQALRRDWSWLFVGRGVDMLAVMVAHRDPAEAARRVGAGDALREHVGARRFQLDQQRMDALVPKLRAHLGANRYDELYAHGHAHAVQIVDQVCDAGADGAAVVVQVVAPPVLTVVAAPSAPAAAAATAQPAARAREADLRAHMLGPMQVWVRAVLVDSWAYAKPKELLAYLLAYPQGRSRAAIAAAIWPGSTPAQARNTFHVTMHHLRKALGHADWIVLENDRYAIAPGVLVATDAAEFEQEVRTGMRNDDADATLKIAHLRRALALYGDHFLAGDVAGGWRDEEQDRLRRIYADAALRLGALLEQAGNPDEAVGIYEDMIVREPLLEEAHRRLIMYWTRTGDRIRAIRHYDRLAMLLRDELELEPDAETAELYERARQL